MTLQIGGEFIDAPYTMICASAEAEADTYTLHIGKSGKRWLLSTKPNKGEGIYVEGNPNSDGFGGRTITFTLEDGSELALKGPWHSNSDSFFKDTGIDVRDTFLTFGVIGRGRSWKDGRSVITDLIWFDDEPVLGTFDRVQKLAEQMSHERKEVLYYFKSSRGGSFCGPVNWKEYGNDEVA